MHSEIEAFKKRVYGTEFHGRTVGAWNRLLSTGGEELIGQALVELFEIGDLSKELKEAALLSESD